MKKILFSAVAMIAFTGASLANTIANKEEVIKKDCIAEATEKTNTEEEAWHQLQLRGGKDYCYGPYNYQEVWNDYYDQCKSGTKGLSPN